jgi:hypothetical protein
MQSRKTITYKLGVIGKRKGKCCGKWCLDCDFIRRDLIEKCEHEFYECKYCMKCGWNPNEL